MSNEEIKYDPSQEDHISISLITLERLIQARLLGLIDLYVFYLKTAKWQQTRQTKCLDIYVTTVMKIGKERLTNLKAKLKELGLIEVVREVDKAGKFSGSYIKVNYTRNPRNPLAVEPPTGSRQHMLYNNNKMLINNKIDKNIIKENLEVSQQAIISCFSFDDFWNAYDYKMGKPKCIKYYSKIVETDRALIKKHVIRYVDSTMKPSKPEQGKVSRKHPGTYLYQECWNDELDVEEPTGFKDNPSYKVYQRASGAYAVSGVEALDKPLMKYPVMCNDHESLFFWNGQQVLFDVEDDCYTLDGKTPIDPEGWEAGHEHCARDIETSIKNFQKELALWRDGKGAL